MKRLKLFLFVMLSASLLSGQGLEIRYFAHNDSIAYLLDGKPTSKPRIRAGEMATLRIIGYNNYLYKAAISARDEKTVSAPAAGAFSELMPGGAGSLASPVGLLMSIFNPSGAPLSFNPDDFNLLGRGSGFGNASAEKISAIARQFQSATAYIKVLEEDIRQEGMEIRQGLESQQVSSIAAEEIRKLKRNPGIPPQKIRALSKEYLETVLGARQAEGLSLGEVLRKAEASQDLAQSLDSYSRYADTLAAELEKVAAIQASLEQLQAEEAFIERVAAYHQSGSMRLAEYQQTAEMAREKLPEVQNLSVPNLLALRYELEELDANTFSYTYRTTAEGDALSISMALEPVDSAEGPGVQLRELPSLQIPVYGGFKVTAGVGVSFGGFFRKPQGYFIRDSTIVAEDQDRFLPVITSFVHFYPQSAGNISLGGSFGIGLPLGGETGAQSISFFLGPCLILGKGERITINGGLMGAKAKRLGQGYQVGDYFVYEPGPSIGSEADVVPTRSAYEFGYFLGVSFSLFSGN